MTLKLRDAGLLAGAMALLGTHFGCGRVANVLESPESGGGGMKGSSDTNHVVEQDGGLAGFGPGGGPPLLADGGTPPPFAQGGAPYGYGGKAGAPSFGGVIVFADASTGIAGNHGLPTGTAGSAGAPASLDPHGPERHELAQKLCALADQNPCLKLQSASGMSDGECQNEVESNGVGYTADGCWNEWVAHANCALARTDYCPCSGDGCSLNPSGPDYGPECTATDSALDNCLQTQGAHGITYGTVGAVGWHSYANGCNTTWYGPYHDITQANCTGSGDSPQRCTCTANGAFLGDEAQYIGTGAYSGGVWYGSSCADAAQQVADGVCSHILDCCFTWSYHENPDSGPIDECGCTADPKQAGYDSCEAIAAAGNGKVVDICPRYVPDPGSFPGKPPHP